MPAKLWTQSQLWSVKPPRLLFWVQNTLNQMRAWRYQSIYENKTQTKSSVIWFHGENMLNDFNITKHLCVLWKGTYYINIKKCPKLNATYTHILKAHFIYISLRSLYTSLRHTSTNVICHYYIAKIFPAWNYIKEIVNHISESHSHSHRRKSNEPSFKEMTN